MRSNRQTKKNTRNGIKNQDNTDVKKIDEYLLNIEEKYRNLYESSPDLLRTIDTKEIITDCNKTYAGALGYTKEEIIGKSIFEHTAEQSYGDMKRSIKEWMKTGRIVNQEIWLKRKDGTIFPTLLSGTNLYDKDYKIIGRTVSLRDITENYNSRKILQEKLNDLIVTHKLLLKTEEKYRNLYDNSPVLYRTIDIKGIIHDCNRSYANALGYTKEEIIGKSVFDHVVEKSRHTLQESFYAWSTTGQTGKERLIWLKRKDGTAFPTMLSATSLYDKEGKLIGSNTIIRNISDIYSAKQEVEEEKIKRLFAIGELAGRIAHDLRNPMSVIKNAVTLIRMQNPNLEKMALDKFSLIDMAITRMSHQIDEVLDFVKQKPLSMVHTSTTGILQDTISRMVIPSTINIDLPSNKIDITCDPYKMEMVFVNLISNAMQAMSNNGTITIRASENKDSVQLDVEDTGPGIHADTLPKIFDPLFTTRQVGTGLGLTSCKSIVEQHGGTIEVKTAIGKGTTFSITIPKLDLNAQNYNIKAK